MAIHGCVFSLHATTCIGAVARTLVFERAQVEREDAILRTTHIDPGSLACTFTGKEATHFCPAFPSPKLRHLALVLLGLLFFCMMTWHCCSVHATLDIFLRLGTSRLPFFLRGLAFDPGAHTVCSDCFSVSPAAQFQAGNSRRAVLRSPSNEPDQRGPSGRGTNLPLMRHDVRHVKRSGVSQLGKVGKLWGSLVLASLPV